MTTALLQTTYFGPVQWYQKLHRYDHCLIEQYDSFSKQTYRNRCVIATANGVQALTVPVISLNPQPSSLLTLTKDIRISDHNQWRRVHWNALQSAYSESPFFEYYADDLHPFFETRYEFLLDIEYTTGFMPTHADLPVADFREVISAKHPQPDDGFEVKPYWQVFRHRHGFLPNLSILDLLFNMGPESIYYL